MGASKMQVLCLASTARPALDSGAATGTRLGK
jgi:hypothetical protein